MLKRTEGRWFGVGAVPREATVLELLFDIVYVFALARLAGRVADDLTIVRHTLLSEAGQTLLFFIAMWMIWSLNALMSSVYDPRSPSIQVALLATMFGTLVLAVSLPQAFGERGVIFACTYVLIQVGRPLYLTLALRPQPEWRQPARVLAWHVASGVLWLCGAATAGLGRGILWTAALAVEVLGSALSWPAPRLGLTRSGYARVNYEHLAERYNQFFMIALAEVVLETGAAVSFPGFSLERTVVLVAAFLAVVAFWRMYFYHVGRGPAPSRARGGALRLNEWSSFSLLLIVAGVICTAVGYGQIIRHMNPPVDWALVVVIFGGPALFLVGRAYLEGPTPLNGQCPALYLGLLALGVVAPVMVVLPPIAAAVAVGVILAGAAGMDFVIHRQGPETNPPL
ncbi:low temperature requirement protein A [Micromonospora sp. URMC 103]|uniref:low temperature requirement protein A n=1 Tax=Micromonospora sp. URMC 103 TaxID=3423406 RepID=UPI003F1B97D9